MTVSDDENLLAYATDTTGYRQYVLHVKDLRTGETLDDTAERVTAIEWAADNKTLFYVTEDPVTKRSDRLWRHTLGDESPEPVYEEADEVFRLDLSKSRDKKFIFLNVLNSDSSEVHYLDATDPRCGLRLILAREPHHRYRVDHREGQFYIRTNKGAKNFQVVTTPADDPDPRNWKVFIEAAAERAVGPPRPVQEFRRGAKQGQRAVDRPRARFPQRPVAHSRFSRAGLLAVRHGQSRVRRPHVPLQLSEHGHALERLRL